MTINETPSRNAPSEGYTDRKSLVLNPRYEPMNSLVAILLNTRRPCPS